jgi:two-component system, NtrC family, sensor kinase
MAKLPKGSIEGLSEGLGETQHWVMVAKLVTGLVHEINNPLDGIINCIRTVRSGKLNKEREQEYLAMAEQELFRITTLTKRLLGLARDNPPTLATADLNEMVEKSLFFVDYRRTQSCVKLKRSLDSRLPTVKADQTSILQVIVNLLQNAIESMPDGGTLTVRTEADAQWVRLSVSDTGSGIPAENRDRIFYPFFTTKPGTGTGLGLAISQSIAEQHQGGITVRSEVGKGSTFTLRLPRPAAKG